MIPIVGPPPREPGGRRAGDLDQGKVDRHLLVGVDQRRVLARMRAVEPASSLSSSARGAGDEPHCPWSCSSGAAAHDTSPRRCPFAGCLIGFAPSSLSAQWACSRLFPPQTDGTVAFTGCSHGLAGAVTRTSCESPSDGSTIALTGVPSVAQSGGGEQAEEVHGKSGTASRAGLQHPCPVIQTWPDLLAD